MNKLRWVKITGVFFILMLLAIVSLGAAPRVCADNSIQGSKVSSLLSLHVKIKAKLAQSLSPREFGGNTNLNTEKVFIHFTRRPTEVQLSELDFCGITSYPDSWIPPVGCHPTGFILADMPVDRLDILANKDYIIKLDTAEEIAEPQNDVSRAAMGVDNVWSAGYTGAGVTVAVLDSGIDTLNPDFPALNDLNSKDYSNYPILDNTITNLVTGHGTHVTGSLLGRGVNSAAYKGVAPDARLIFLKIGNDIDSNASSSSVIYAIRDAADVYHARIITMSYGFWSTYHDGTDQESQAVDYAVSLGAAVFISAGNEAGKGHHYSGTIAAGSTSVDIPVAITSGTSFLPMDLVWFDGLGIRNSLILKYYDSSHALLASTSGSQSQSPRGTESVQSQLNSTVTAGTYYLRVQNNSTSSQFFHIYYIENTASATFATPDPNYTLTSPSDADSAIAVGAYVVRNTWKDYQGTSWNSSTAPVGSVATFSSRGPRVDSPARGKPDIVAPGQAVISVRDNNVYPWPVYNTQADIYPYSNRIIDNDGLNLNSSGPADYFIMSGTSMSCPLAAGFGALLLSKTTTLTPAQLKHTLERTASKAAVGHDTSWGWGLVNDAAFSTSNTTLISYSDLTHATLCDDFSNLSTQNTAFISGTGYLSNYHYQIAYYDGSNHKIATENIISTSTGTLSSQHTFMLGTDVPGTWHVIVEEPEFSLPVIYSSTSPYTIATGTFKVQDSAIATPGPTVISTIKVGGGGYGPAGLGVNTATNRIYVTNYQSNNVVVIDASSNKVVATVNVGVMPEGIAVNAISNRIYASAAVSNIVSVIDGANNSVLATVNVGTQPYRLGVNTATDRIYIANTGSNNVSVIDGSTNNVTAIVNVGGGPSGVGVNPITNLIYVSNDQTNNVSVINGISNNVTATVNVGSGPGGIEVNPTTNRIYVANYGSNSISVIDGASNSVVATVNVGSAPRGVAVNPLSNRIYVANYNSDNVSVIDGSSNIVLATVKVGSRPFDVGVNPATNLIYVSNVTTNDISVIEGVGNNVVATISVGSGTDTLGVNSATNQIYIAGQLSNRVSILEGSTNNLTAEVNVGSGPTGMGVNAATNRIYVANHGDNNVSVIDGASNSVVDTINVGKWPFGIGVNPTTNRLYVANSLDGAVSVIDGTNNSVVTTVKVNTLPSSVEVNPTTNRIYVVNIGSNNVSVIDGASNSVESTIDVGSLPQGIGINPTTNRIYVANGGSNNVSVIDGISNNVITTVGVGSSPRGVAVNPITNRIYVANNGSGSISVIDGAGNRVMAAVTVGNGPRDVGVNPGSNRVYVTSYWSDTVSVIQDSGIATATIVSSVNPSSYGQSVTFTANLTALLPEDSTPTGTVTFKDGTNTLGTWNLSGLGQADVSTSSLSVGNHTISALYSGDSNFAPDTATLTQIVNQGSSATAVASSPNPSGYGQIVTFNVTVSAVSPAAGIPSGIVAFMDGTEVLGTGNLNASGQATCSISSLSVGSHSITAIYSGDSNFNISTSPVVLQIVNKAATTTSVISSANPSTYGQAVTFNITVSAVPPAISGTPTGLVTLKDGATLLGTWNLDIGQVIYATSALTAGNHTIDAFYDGDDNFAVSTNNLTQTVNLGATTTALTSSLNPSNPGNTVTFTATVSAIPPATGTPTGTIIFKEGGTTLATGNLSGSGQATYSTSTLSTGSHTINAFYGGDINFGISTYNLTQTVNQASGGGGGGGGGAPSTTTVSMDILGSHPSLRLFSNGAVAAALKASSSDGKLDISLPAGTLALLSGKPITTFSITSGNSPAAPQAGTTMISPTYECGPGGATFNPPFSLVYHFSADLIPAGVDKTDLYLAYYDTQTSTWMPFPGAVDASNNTLTGAIAHFTSFAVFAPAAANFTLSGLEVSPSQVVAGDKVTIAVTVNNSGGKAGSYQVSLKINAEVDQFSSIGLSAGESKKVTFTVTRQQAGKYVVKVGELSGSFTVTTPEPSPTPTPVAAPAPASIPTTLISTPAPLQSPVLTQAATLPPTPTPPAVPASALLPTPVPTPGTSWGLTGGIIAAVVIAVILILVLIFTRRKATHS